MKHAKIILLFIVLHLPALVIVVGSSAGENQPPELTLRGELPSLRATYPEILQFSNDIEQLVQRSIKNKVERDEDKSRLSSERVFTYQIETKHSALAGKSLDLLLKDSRLPNPANIFTIHWSAYSEPISRIDVSFRDFSSPYELSGTDMLALESLHDRIELFGQEHRTWSGGLPIIIVCWMLMIGCGVALLAMGGQFRKTWARLVSMSCGSFVIVVSFYLFSSGGFMEWFPTTAIFMGSASFMGIPWNSVSGGL